MRYFEIGENFNFNENSEDPNRWFYDHKESDFLTSCLIKDNVKNCLPQILDNPFFLKKYFVFDIKKWENGSADYVSEKYKNLDFEFGEAFSKNVFKGTYIGIYTPEKSNQRILYISGVETYSRRSEGKERIYPVTYIANRIRWFLCASPYVASFEEKSKKMSHDFIITFKK